MLQNLQEAEPVYNSIKSKLILGQEFQIDKQDLVQKRNGF